MLIKDLAVSFSRLQTVTYIEKLLDCNIVLLSFLPSAVDLWLVLESAHHINPNQTSRPLDSLMADFSRTCSQNIFTARWVYSNVFLLSPFY